eukprot:6047680-Ditylum_brightwellii.AAC.1
MELTILKELKISAACLQETNKTGTGQEYTKNKHIINKVWQKNKLETTSSKEQTKTDFQPGGTATLITDKWLSYVCNLGRDEAGRWSYIMLKGTKNRKVTVISAYRVCKNQLSQAGPSTCWKQQW